MKKRLLSLLLTALLITALLPFGAFAEIVPGVDGLIHISQISNKRIEKPADELSIGDEVEAKITGIDFEKKRVSLSIRALLPESNPVAPVVEEEEDEVVAVAEPDAAPMIRDLEDETPAEEPAVEEAASVEEPAVEEAAPAEEAPAEDAAPSDAE